MPALRLLQQQEQQLQQDSPPTQQSATERPQLNARGFENVETCAGLEDNWQTLSWKIETSVWRMHGVTCETAEKGPSQRSWAMPCSWAWIKRSARKSTENCAGYWSGTRGQKWQRLCGAWRDWSRVASYSCWRERSVWTANACVRKLWRTWDWGGEEAGGMMKLGGRGVKIPDLWRRSALEEICLDHQGRAIPRGRSRHLRTDECGQRERQWKGWRILSGRGPNTGCAKVEGLAGNWKTDGGTFDGSRLRRRGRCRLPQKS